MMIIVIGTALFLLNLLTNGAAVFVCPQVNGTFVNRNDYSTYFKCINGISILEWCPIATQYYSTSKGSCQDGPTEWNYLYDLTGTYIVAADTEYLQVYQKGHDLYWTSDTSTVSNTFIGRYINETHIAGVETRLVRLTGCVSVLNVRVMTTGSKSFCRTSSLANFGRMCDLVAHSSSRCPLPLTLPILWMLSMRPVFA